MKKDNIRDYATEAFRYYAACGMKTSEEIKQQVKKQIYDQSKRERIGSGSGAHSDCTAYSVMAADDEMYEMAAEFLDIIAVEKTLRQLNKYQRTAVEIVYFAEANKELSKNDISQRVHKAELSIPAEERTIYRWLSKARKIFARERGLRVI